MLMFLFCLDQSLNDEPPRDIFLFLDEVPCNSNWGTVNLLWGKPSGDWTGLNNSGVNLMMALQPINDNFHQKGFLTDLLDKFQKKDSSLKVSFPQDIPQIKLDRVFRCTQNITKFYEVITNEMSTLSLIGYYNRNASFNSDSLSYSVGHDIHGNLPEILLLPQCDCFWSCKFPLEHIFTRHKTKILGLIRRVKSQIKSQKLTVITETEQCKEACELWLKEQLQGVL